MATKVFPPIYSGDNEELDKSEASPRGQTIDESTGKGFLSWGQPGQGQSRSQIL